MHNNGSVIEENVKLICKQKFFVRSEMRSKTQKCWNVLRNNLRRSIVPTTSHFILQVTVSSSKSSTFNYSSHAFIWSNIEVDVLFSLVIGSLSSTSISVISVRDLFPFSKLFWCKWKMDSCICFPERSQNWYNQFNTTFWCVDDIIQLPM